MTSPYRNRVNTIRLIVAIVIALIPTLVSGQDTSCKLFDAKGKATFYRDGTILQGKICDRGNWRQHVPSDTAVSSPGAMPMVPVLTPRPTTKPAKPAAPRPTAKPITK